MKDNPYVGPRPYERADQHNFYGRDREARELRALIVAEREVLFYAQSGAGKTSLLNARVIPALEEKGFRVLPVARVGNELPPGIDPSAVDNVFAFSALLSLAGQDADPQECLGHTLLSFLQERCREPEEPFETRPPVLILDQFEELFTTHRERWQEAEGFFCQVREALDGLPGLGVVFAMREDRVAEVDPYAALFPRRLRARLRMERLGPGGALAAVERPARNAGCPFAPGVAERLVDDLRRSRVYRERRTEGQSGFLGPFVEPVQLQVVCNRLWANLPDQKDDAIQWAEVERYGDIDRALTDFYESALDLAKVPQSSQGWGVSERELRRWFGEQLITPMGTRGLALRGPEATAGLPNAAVDVLEGQHLVRADVRAGARWYELAHDRLVEPILQSNAAWEAARETPLRAVARRWRETEDPALLYQDAALAEACAWAEANPGKIEPYETEFLDASRQAEQARVRRRRLFVGVGVVVAIVLVLLAVLTLAAFQGQRQARAAQATAEVERQEADEARTNALASKLTAQAQVVFSSGGYGFMRSLLLTTESLNRVPSLEAEQTLRQGLALLARPVAKMVHKDVVWPVAFSPDGQYVVSASWDGTAKVWETMTGAEVTRFEHENLVRDAAFSPDGRYVATASIDGVIWVWEAATGAEVALMEHAQEVRVIAFSPDGRYLVSGSDDRTARVWEVASGTELARMTHEAAVLTVAFGPGCAGSTEATACEQWVASGGEDGIVQVWEATTGAKVAGMAHDDQVMAVAFSPDREYLVSGSQDGTARVWEADTGREMARAEHGHGVNDVAFQPVCASVSPETGAEPCQWWVVSGSDEGAVWVWEAETGKEVSRTAHEAGVNSVAFGPDGQYVASASDDWTARVWHTATGREVARMEHEEAVFEAAFGPDGRYVVTGSWDETARVWEVSPETDLFQIEQDGAVEAVAFSPDGKWVASGSWDSTARVWEVATGVEVIRVEHGGGVNAVAFGPDGRRVVSGSEDGTVWVWEAQTGTLITQMAHEALVWDVAFSPDGQYVASGGKDGTLRVWDAGTGEEIVQMAHDSAVHAVAFGPDGQYVASGSKEGLVRVWDVVAGTQVVQMAHEDAVHAVAFGPAGQYVASGSWDWTARVWEVTTGQEVAQVRHEDGVNAVAFGPGGRYVASAGQDSTVQVWEAGTGRIVVRLDQEEAVYAVAFSPECGNAPGAAAEPCGRYLASGTNKGTLRVQWWQYDDLTGEACTRVTRNLTQKEWEQYLPGEPYNPTCVDLQSEE